MKDSVTVDAKRILLRYGCPIKVLDKVSREERIRLASEVTRTPLRDRQQRLRQLLQATGHIGDGS